MNCIIVDDDVLARKAITKCIDRTDFLNLVGVCENAIDASNLLDDTAVDLIFLDVEMPEMTGMEFIKSLVDKPYIILTTSKKEYAAEAFEYEVTDYLVKPVVFDRFLKAVKKLKKSESSETTSLSKDLEIFVKVDSVLRKIDTKDIVWIDALGDYIIINTIDKKKYTVYTTMKKIEQQLPYSKFARIHRSHIVRIDKILAIDDYVLHVADQSLVIGRSYKDALKSKLNIIK